MAGRNRESLQLQRLLQSNGNPFAALKEFVIHLPTTSQDCSKEMMECLQSKLTELIESPHFLAERLADGQTILQLIQQLSTYEQHQEGIHVLLEHGLLRMLADALISSLHWVRDQVHESADRFYEDCLETIVVVADYSTRTKVSTTELFCDRFLQLIASESFRFCTRLEALKSVNILLERCPLVVRERLNEHPYHRDIIHNTGMLISEIGDYEFQVGIIESLFRLIGKQNRKETAQAWFASEDILNAFVEIRDSEFETDCRIFLNMLNSHSRTHSSVYSYPCKKVALGEFELHKPDDENYSNFWVDFNAGSKRITLFCNQELPDSQEEDETMWETACIWSDNVTDYQVDDFIDGCQINILLCDDARDLVTFAPATLEGHTVTFEFEQNVDVMQNLLQQIFGQKRNKQKLKVTEKKVSSAENVIQISTTMNSQYEETEDMIPCTQVELSQDSRLTTPRRKISEPCELMVTPTISKQSLSSQEDKQVHEAEEAVPVKKPTSNMVKTQVKVPSKTVNSDETGYRKSSKGADSEQCDQQKQSRRELSNGRLVSSASSEHNDEMPPPNEAVKVSESIVDVELVPSSCPDEGLTTVPETQPAYERAMKATLPALSSQMLDVSRTVDEMQDEEIQSEGMDDQDAVTSSLEISSRRSTRGKMAALKKKLADSDPDYSSFPANKHKVSSTPILSTVDEESTPKSDLSSRRGTFSNRTTPMSTIHEEGNLEDNSSLQSSQCNDLPSATEDQPRKTRAGKKQQPRASKRVERGKAKSTPHPQEISAKVDHFQKPERVLQKNSRHEAVSLQPVERENQGEDHVKPRVERISENKKDTDLKTPVIDTKKKGPKRAAASSKPKQSNKDNIKPSSTSQRTRSQSQRNGVTQAAGDDEQDEDELLKVMKRTTKPNTGNIVLNNPSRTKIHTQTNSRGSIHITELEIVGASCAQQGRSGQSVEAENFSNQQDVPFTMLPGTVCSPSTMDKENMSHDDRERNGNIIDADMGAKYINSGQICGHRCPDVQDSEVSSTRNSHDGEVIADPKPSGYETKLKKVSRKKAKGSTYKKPLSVGESGSPYDEISNKSSDIEPAEKDELQNEVVGRGSFKAEQRSRRNVITVVPESQSPESKVRQRSKKGEGTQVASVARTDDTSGEDDVQDTGSGISFGMTHGKDTCKLAQDMRNEPYVKSIADILHEDKLHESLQSQTDGIATMNSKHNECRKDKRGANRYPSSSQHQEIKGVDKQSGAMFKKQTFDSSVKQTGRPMKKKTVGIEGQMHDFDNPIHGRAALKQRDMKKCEKGIIKKNISVTEQVPEKDSPHTKTRCKRTNVLESESLPRMNASDLLIIESDIDPDPYEFKEKASDKTKKSHKHEQNKHFDNFGFTSSPESFHSSSDKSETDKKASYQYKPKFFKARARERELASQENLSDNSRLCTVEKKSILKKSEKSYARIQHGKAFGECKSKKNKSRNQGGKRTALTHHGTKAEPDKASLGDEHNGCLKMGRGNSASLHELHHGQKRQLEAVTVVQVTRIDHPIKQKEKSYESDESITIEEFDNLSGRERESTSQLRNEICQDSPQEDTQTTLQSFAEACEKIVAQSECRSRQPEQCHSPRSISAQHISSDVSPIAISPKSSRRKSGRRTSFDPYTLDIPDGDEKKKKHRSIFSETDETRSDISWVGSTARKKQRIRPKAYAVTHKAARPKLLGRGMHEIESDAPTKDETEIPTPPRKAKHERKRKQVLESPHVMTDENTDEDLYYDRQREHRKKPRLRREPNKKALGCFDTSQAKALCTPKTPLNTAKRKPLQNISNQENLLNRSTPSANNDDIEIPRFEDCLHPTPYMIEDLSPACTLPSTQMCMELMSAASPNLELSPINCDALFEVMTELSGFSQTTHISTLKTPKTPAPLSPLEIENDEYGEVITLPSHSMEDKSKERNVDNVGWKSGPCERKKLSEEALQQLMNYDEEEWQQDFQLEEPITRNHFTQSSVGPLHEISSFRPRILFPTDTPDIQSTTGGDNAASECEEELVTLNTSLHQGVSSLITSFSSEIHKNIMEKKQHLDSNMSETVTALQQDIAKVWRTQRQAREIAYSEFQQTIMRELKGIEADIAHGMDLGEKLEAFVTQHISSLQKCRHSQQNRMKNVKNEEIRFDAQIGQIELQQSRQQVSVRDMLKAEMARLQRKILNKTQNDEMANVKKTLHTLFS